MACLPAARPQEQPVPLATTLMHPEAKIRGAHTKPAAVQVQLSSSCSYSQHKMPACQQARTPLPCICLTKVERPHSSSQRRVDWHRARLLPPESAVSASQVHDQASNKAEAAVQAGRVYGFQLTAYVADQPSTAATATVQVTVQHSPLRAGMDGGTARAVSAQGAVSVVVSHTQSCGSLSQHSHGSSGSSPNTRQPTRLHY